MSPAKLADDHKEKREQKTTTEEYDDSDTRQAIEERKELKTSIEGNCNGEVVLPKQAGEEKKEQKATIQQWDYNWVGMAPTMLTGMSEACRTLILVRHGQHIRIPGRGNLTKLGRKQANVTASETGSPFFFPPLLHHDMGKRDRATHSKEAPLCPQLRERFAERGSSYQA